MVEATFGKVAGGRIEKGVVTMEDKGIAAVDKTNFSGVKGGTSASKVRAVSVAMKSFLLFLGG